MSRAKPSQISRILRVLSEADAPLTATEIAAKLLPPIAKNDVSARLAEYSHLVVADHSVRPSKFMLPSAAFPDTSSTPPSVIIPTAPEPLPKPAGRRSSLRNFDSMALVDRLSANPKPPAKRKNKADSEDQDT